MRLGAPTVSRAPTLVSDRSTFSKLAGWSTISKYAATTRFREVILRFREVIFRFREVIFRFREVIFRFSDDGRKKKEREKKRKSQ